MVVRKIEKVEYMGKIVYLIGKSSSGKDTIYKKLLEEKEFAFQMVVAYTTRPIRAGETNGIEYYFTDETGFKRLQSEGKVIEERSYDTVQGIWRYFTVLDDTLDLTSKDYLMIGTLESYQKTKEYIGKEGMIPIFVDVDDGERLQRALDRERRQQNPQYGELCRRFLADLQDFTEEKIKESGIEKIFWNNDLEECLEEIKRHIREEIRK